MDLDKLTPSVVRVGRGRGFVVQERQRFGKRLIITAANCVPRLPPCYAGATIGQRTYKNLIAPVGEKPTIWAECLFADPVADIAVLGEPDSQDLYDQCEQY